MNIKIDINKRLLMILEFLANSKNITLDELIEEILSTAIDKPNPVE